MPIVCFLRMLGMYICSNRGEAAMTKGKLKEKLAEGVEVAGVEIKTAGAPKD